MDIHCVHNHFVSGSPPTPTMRSRSDIEMTILYNYPSLFPSKEQI